MSRLLARALVGGAGLALIPAGITTPNVPALMSVSFGLLLVVTAAVGSWRLGLGLGTAMLLSWCAHLRGPLALFGLLAVLGLLCAGLAWGRWSRVALRELARPEGLVIAGLLVFGGARWFTRAEWAAAPDAVLRGFLPLCGLPVGLSALVVAARAWPASWVDRPLAWWDRCRPRQAWILAGAATGGAALTAWFALGPLPHVEDEIAYQFSARCLLTGGLTVPTPEPAGAFAATFAWITQDAAGRMYGIFPPGWPLLLAVGEAVRLGWLVNPLLCGLTALLMWHGVAAARDERTAGWATALYCVSPFVLVQGGSFLAHPATLFWISLAAWGVARIDLGPRAALAVGLGLGGALATRYVEGLLLGVVLVAVLARAPRPPARDWLLILVAALPGCALTLADNAAKTGDARVTPVEQFYIERHGEAINRPGFGADRGLVWDHSLGPGHTPLEGLWNLNANLVELNRLLFGWACGSLALALLGWRGGRSRYDALQRGFAGGLLVVYWTYWYHNLALGPRALHPLVVPLALATVDGGRRVLDWLGAPREAFRRRLAALLAAAWLAAWLSFQPAEWVTTLRNHRGRHASDRAVIAAAREAAGGRPALVVLVQRLTDAGLQPDYGTGLALNRPGFRGDVVIARSLDEEGRDQVAALRAAYRDRVILMWYKEADGRWRLEPLGAMGGRP